MQGSDLRVSEFLQYAVELTLRVLEIERDPPVPRVFVMSWLDYCNKYGMGFAMTDGTVSVHFNDSSSLVLAPAKK